MSVCKNQEVTLWSTAYLASRQHVTSPLCDSPLFPWRLGTQTAGESPILTSALGLKAVKAKFSSARIWVISSGMFCHGHTRALNMGLPPPPSPSCPFAHVGSRKYAECGHTVGCPVMAISALRRSLGREGQTIRKKSQPGSLSHSG